ncbi:MAG: archaeal heat shock protein Hsp20 [Candidatus Thermoplasmatota archaeon]
MTNHDADKDDDKRKPWKRDPFGFFGMDDDIERMFREMERMMERAFRDFSPQNMKPGKSFVHGFNIHIGPDGKPRVQEFGNRSRSRKSKDEQPFSEEREPLTDVMESDEEVSITVELPGVEKNDIDLKATEENLEIHVNTPQRKYHKTVDLPCEVKPKTTEATYKNGVLDVAIKKKEKKKSDDGYHVDIQ